MALAPPLRAFALTNPRLWRQPVSPTFHARDIFAPVAAHLSLGVPPEEVGEPLREVLCLSIPTPVQRGEALEGKVLAVDPFGNIVTNIPADALPGGPIEVEIGGRRVPGLAETYGRGEGLMALIGSHGFLEVAVRNGNAARLLGVGVGHPLWVWRKAQER